MTRLDHQRVRSVATDVVLAGETLRRAGAERRALWIARACARLRDPRSPIGKAARERVPEAAGLSPEMVAWALETTLAPITVEALVALEKSVTPPHPRAVRARPGQLCAVLLAGNVFTAAVRAVAWPLLFGWPVIAKASSSEQVFATLIETALSEADPELADAQRTLLFDREDDALVNALFEQADAVSVFGSDTTLNHVRANVGANVSFIGHGHGLGAAIIGAGALQDEQSAREAAQGLALDVAAYDQRGCMSPHAVWVERGAKMEARLFALLLFRELEALRTKLPRAQLPMGDASAQLSWRGVSSLRGELIEGDGFALSYEEKTPLRVSPGQRNLQVITTDNLDEACERLAPLGVHLKCLGLAGIDAAELAGKLPPRVAPRLCPVGQMQTPPVDALHDGVPAWEGLVRWVER
jgi:acyl-CoA reductase-like NAD-dependent aldehyde dehydrogenase